MLRCYLSNLVALHVSPPQFVAVGAGERSLASPLARLQARTTARVTNLRHRLVELSELDRLTLQYLNGLNDRAALVEMLSSQVAAQTLTLAHDGVAVSDREQVREFLSENLDACLGRLGRESPCC